jgi:HD superfamily phosphohydrolase YqeK
LVLILIQAGLLCDFYLHYFALMQLANLQHFPNLCDNFWFNTIWHKRYTTFFSLTQFGIDDPWPHLSVGG